MRFIHTADWHLGRLFHTVHLTDDQAYVLDQFVDLVAEVRPTAVLVAGDVYDRGVPPPDAVALLDDVLQRIVRGLKVPVVLIAGNHDSPARLGFGSRLLAGEGLHIAGPLPPGGVLTVLLADDDGPLAVHAVPYADPAVVRDALRSPDGEPPTIHGHEQAMQALVARAQAATPDGARSLFVAHAFVAGATTSDSERPLSVGGAGAVPARVFDGFDYVALGHLHRPQRAGADALRYAGSLLTYSFDEVDHHKSVSIVEIGAPGSGVLQAAAVAAGAAQREGAGSAAGDDPFTVAGPAPSPAAARVGVEQVELSPRRRVRVVEGTLDDVLAAGRAASAAERDDYVCARLLNKGVLLNAMGRLREEYPNALHLEFPALQTPAGAPAGVPAAADRSDAEHFAEFYRYVTDEPLSDAERRAFIEVADRLERERRDQ